jgi:hypothetical protein
MWGQRLAHNLLPPVRSTRAGSPDDRPVGKGTLCAQTQRFNLHAATSTTWVDLQPLAFIVRLAALVPAPKRHLTRYFGVLSSHAASRSEVVPDPAEPTPADDKGKPAAKSKYIPWAELLRKTFGFELVCQKCQSPLRLIALIKNEAIAKKILTAMHLPAEVPQLHPARPPPQKAEAGGDDWAN